MTRLAILISGILAVILTVATAFRGELIFAATAMWALTMVLAPFSVIPAARGFSVWALTCLTIGIGVVARGLYLSLGVGDASTLDRLYFLGEEPEFFLVPAVLLLIGLGALTAGYLSGKPRSLKLPPLQIHPPTLYAMALGILLVSTIATILYIQRTGGWESGLFSAKRTVIPSLDLAGSGYKSHGALRFVASLAIFGHLLVLADWLREKRPWKLALGLVLLAVACTLPFYASVRTTVAMFLLFPIALIAQKRFVLPAVLAVVGVVVVMTALRPGENSSAILESLVLNRNQVDLPKTAHIYHSDLAREYGRTITRWLAAPVPRELWTNKPVIPPGPIIGNQIYGQRVAGVPPSMMAEWFWNFGWLGVVLGSFVFGWFLRWLDQMPSDPFRSALFVAGPMLVGYEAVGSSIGGGLYQCGFRWVILALLLWCVRLRRK